jgi:hypothetical protein
MVNSADCHRDDTDGEGLEIEGEEMVPGDGRIEVKVQSAKCKMQKSKCGREVQPTFCKFTATVTAIFFPAVPSRNEP